MSNPLSRKLLQPRTQTPAFVFRSSSTTAARPLSLTVFIRHGLQLTSPSGISQGNDTETISMAPALRMTKRHPPFFCLFKVMVYYHSLLFCELSRVRVMLSAIFLGFGFWISSAQDVVVTAWDALTTPYKRNTSDLQTLQLYSERILKYYAFGSLSGSKKKLGRRNRTRSFARSE